MNEASDINYEDITQKRRVHANRRRMANHLREARNTLLQKAGVSNQEFEYELLQMFVRNELRALVTIPLFAVLIAITCCLWAPHHQVLIWLASVIISKGISLWLCQNFTKIPKQKANVKSWRTKITTAEFLFAVSWASIAFVDISNNDHQAHFFIFASIIVMVAIRMMFASTVLSLIYVGTIPMTLALTIRFIMTDDMFYWTIAALSVGIHLYFCILVEGLHKNVLDMFAYRAEKDFLIAEIEEAKLFSDEACRRAEDANYAKSQFLATMSHELRTPLNAILGFSEVMKDEILGAHSNTCYRDYAQDIHDSGKHLLKLINEILDLSRIEAGRYELHEELLTLSHVIEDCVRLMKLKADSKNLKIIEDYNDQEIKLWSDERAIRQICLNLLSNAIKFTPSGGTIMLNINLDSSEELILCVADTGPGIPEKEIPLVLANFGQGSLAHATAEGGSGLGLPIVQGLISLQDGRFKLESEMRKGTSAFVIFPAKRVNRILPQMPDPREENNSINTSISYEKPRVSTRKTKPKEKDNISDTSKHHHADAQENSAAKTQTSSSPTVEDLKSLAYAPPQSQSQDKLPEQAELTSAEENTVT
ncbi:MAG: HAMP domain-containing sensor histidine kinase [Pseudomonadota bacterium]